jgi:hypothetical protein
MARYSGHVRDAIGAFGSTFAVAGLTFDRVDSALEKTRWVLRKLQRDLVSPLVKFASMLILGESKSKLKNEWRWLDVNVTCCGSQLDSDRVSAPGALVTNWRS